MSDWKYELGRGLATDPTKIFESTSISVPDNLEFAFVVSFDSTYVVLYNS